MSPIGNASARVRPFRRSALLALGAAAALTVAACGEAPTGALNTRAGYTADGAEVPVSICPEGESHLTDEEGTLIGPHFALRVECAASFDEIPEDYQLEYLLGEGTELFPPPAGHEFTVVQFAPEPGVEAQHPVKDDTELEGTLAIGEQTWDFDGEVPAPGSAYFAVAQEGAPITLEVNDTDRTQSMDLRERTRDGLIEAYYQGSRRTITTDSVENTVSAYLESGSYQYSLDEWTYVVTFVVDRSVFTEDEGWVADADRARLSIDFVWFRETQELGLVWDIDPEEVLEVSGPDGALEAAEVDSYDEDWDGDQVGRYYTLTYDVPAEALEFDLTFHPTGHIQWEEEGVDMPVDGDEEHEVSVDFG
ncbi:hypothetical protein [Glycomyces xiaoerkulensis]|uniref:hypothetical protein n=1 Tax=Glycomyces xiaoerkulensis TaxID=2038139 RepID=UPI000C259074|nr:hypothetical protein [Glycomyces xiaoerkulensis]